MNKKTFPLNPYLRFSLGDFDKTAQKYRDYVPRGRAIEEGDDDYACLQDGVGFWEVACKRELYFSHWFQTDTPKMSDKQYLRTLNRFINLQTFEYNIQTYKDLGYTPSQSRSLAIRYYVRNYDKINALMVDMMLDAIVSYCTVFSDDIRQQADNLI